MVPVFAILAIMPFAMALMATHAPRWAIEESSLGIAHQEVTIETADGHELSAGTSRHATGRRCS